MLALAVCIALNALLFVLFREFGRRGVVLLQAIPVDYVVCFVGCLIAQPDVLSEIAQAPPDWRWLGLLQGGLFIGMFLFIGWAVTRTGIAYTTLMTKVSVVIPVAVSTLVFAEALTPARAVGIGLAVLSIFLVHRAQRTAVPNTDAIGSAALATETAPSPTALLGIGALLFVGSGLIDTNFKIFDARYAQLLSGGAFTAVLFAVAGGLGLMVLAARIVAGAQRLHARSLLAGVLLGIPNYFTVVLLVQGLRQLPATVFLPANNIGQLLLGGLIGHLLYREPLGRAGVWGLAAAALAIALIVS